MLIYNSSLKSSLKQSYQKNAVYIVIHMCVVFQCAVTINLLWSQKIDKILFQHCLFIIIGSVFFGGNVFLLLRKMRIYNLKFDVIKS